MMNIGAQQQDFSMLSDQQLKQAMMFAQRSNDTPAFLGLMAEANKRKQTRTAAQGQQAGQEVAQSPQTQADQVMSGIANLASGDQEYAGGGIVAFADGGVPGMTDAQGRPYTHLWHAEGSTEQQTPYWESIKEAFGLPIEAIKRLVSAPNQRKYTADQGTAPATSPTQAAPRVEARDKPYINPQAYRDYKGAEVTPPAGALGGGITSVTKKTTASEPPASATAELEKTMTAEELQAKARAMAKGDDDKVAAIFAKAAERDAKRRSDLEGETKATKGWLGAEMDSDTRKALRDAGIAMLQSKRADALGGIGEGLAAAAKGYDERKQKRQDRMDMLDAADEKRQLAQMAAQQGNAELARKYIGEAENLKKAAQDLALKKDEAALDRWYKTQSVENQKAQTAASRAAASRPTDFQWGIGQLMRANPGMKFGDAMRQFVEGKQTARPLSRAEALTAYNAALKSGTLPSGIADFESFYKMASGADGAGGAGAGKTGNPLVDKYLQ